MPFADLGEFRLFYEDLGQGPPIIFLHGFSLDSRMWQPQAEAFRERYRLILPDAKGHGRSDAPETNYSRAHRVDDLRRLADILAIERFHLVGLSMGGSTAIGFALAFQERLLSLTLVSTGAAGYGAGKKFSRLDDIGRSEGPEAAKEQWIRWSLAWYKNGRRAELKPFIEKMMRDYSGAVWKDKMRGKYPKENDLDRVDRISIPTLIVAGELDRIFLPLARQLDERIRDSRLRVYEDVGHMVNLEAPERFTADLKAFLEAGAGS
ncbi:alpha/beta fold hydrolase [candidate division GN15 bacterium]|nr:alpha/beta fold hydrolase [candidate division GN15 bacterium]